MVEREDLDEEEIRERGAPYRRQPSPTEASAVSALTWSKRGSPVSVDREIFRVSKRRGRGVYMGEESWRGGQGNLSSSAGVCSAHDIRLISSVSGCWLVGRWWDSASGLVGWRLWPS